MLDIQQLFHEVSKFNSSSPGITRLAYTEEWLNVRSFLRTEMTKLNLTIYEDKFGTLLGRLPGKNPDAPSVATGSHLDSVPQGGNFDGVLGVLGGLVAISEIKKHGTPQRSIDLILFPAEEASRFGAGMLGSKLLLSLGDQDHLLSLADPAGITLRQTLNDCGFADNSANPMPKSWHAFLELHIEQGPVLERENLDIGIVSAIAGPTHFKVTVTGVAAHSGATPMIGRQDALVAAAKMIVEANQKGLAYTDREIVTTVGKIEAFPGAVNVVPGKVEFLLDIRGTDKQIIWEVFYSLQDSFIKIAEAKQCQIAFERMASDDPTPLNPRIVSQLADFSSQLGYQTKVMPSGAGHDAMNMAAAGIPTGMIFIPSQKGISHNPTEYSSPEQIEKGVKLLEIALEAFANQVP